MSTDKQLRFANIPATMWRNELVPPRDPDEQTKFSSWFSDLEAVYDEPKNLLVSTGSRDHRLNLLYWLAQQIMDQGNPFNRQAVGYKHKIPASLPDGTPVTQPYTVKLMDVEELRDLYIERDKGKRDDPESPSFAEEVLVPDFFFLLEIGHERSNKFFARIMDEFLLARHEAELPTVVSTTTTIKNIEDKEERKVYSEVSTFIKENFRTKVTLS